VSQQWLNLQGFEKDWTLERAQALEDDLPVRRQLAQIT